MGYPPPSPSEYVVKKATENYESGRHESHILSDQRVPYIFHFSNPFFTTHWHKNIEILYFYEDGIYICDGIQYNVSHGDIAVVSSESLHSLLRETKCRHDCLIINGEFLENYGVDVIKMSFSPIIRDDEVRSLFKNVSKEVTAQRENAPFGEIAVKTAVFALITHLCRYYSSFQNEYGAHNNFVKRAIEYIKEHYAESLTVENVAGNVNMSKYYFCREFRKETGYTVNRYINFVRCREAQILLHEGKFSVSEVAYRCGYRNLSYFSRAYKTIIGHTPKGSRPTK